MLFLKKAPAYIGRYVAGLLIAVLTDGIIQLIFKLTLITVQGPTLFSRAASAILFYAALSVAFFFLFRQYGRKQPSYKLKGLFLYSGGIAVLHLVVALAASWSALRFISMGASVLTLLLYTGGDTVRSMTEIPRVYYLIALAAEDICFVVFSQIGYFKGKTNRIGGTPNSLSRS